MLQQFVDADADERHRPQLGNFAKFHQVQFIQQEYGPDEHQEPPGEEPQGNIAAPPAFDYPSANQADPHTIWATQSWHAGIKHRSLNIR